MKVLYLGSDPTRFVHEGDVTHLQIIDIIPRPFTELEWMFSDWEEYTHILFTSKHAVSIFFDLLKMKGLSLNQTIIVVGRTTAKAVENHSWTKPLCAVTESQEGILELLRKIHWHESDYILIPRSSLARGSLADFFLERNLRHQVCDLYDTISKRVDFPDLEQFDQIYFSSPSTVTAFFSQIEKLPKHPELKAIGPVTWQNLTRAINIFDTYKR
jgi:uroporphyrinogen-III synthase